MCEITIIYAQRVKDLQLAKNFVSKLMCESLHGRTEKNLLGIVTKADLHIVKLQEIAACIPYARWSERYVAQIELLKEVKKSFARMLELCKGDDPQIKITFLDQRKM